MREKQTQSEAKKELLDEQIKCFELAIKACKEIQEGKSETYVCSKYNIDRHYFRHMLFNEKFGFKHEPIDLPINDEDNSNYRTYWKNLWADYCWQEKIFCLVFNEYNINNIPTDIDESMEYVLSTIKDREREVLLFRYQDGLSLRQTGEEMGITTERVRQIEGRALRRLRHPSKGNILKYGMAYKNYLDERTANVEKMRLEYEKEIDKLTEEMKGAVTSRSIEDLRKLRTKIDSLLLTSNQKLLKEKDEQQEYADVEIPLVRIEDLPLSVRTYNCLMRGRYKYLHELKGKTVSQMMKLRNFGPMCLEELSNVVANYGIHFIDDMSK